MHRKRLFRPFWDMIHLGIPDCSVDGGEAIDELVSGRGEARLFLGLYGEEGIRERLRHYSVHTRLAELGLADYRVFLDAADPDHQEVRLVPSGSRADRERAEPIAEVIVRESLLRPVEALGSTLGPLAFLVIQWIRLQNPTAPFDPAALLPGQKYPGLGLGRKVMEMLAALTERLHLQGIINRPEFAHNAVLYSEYFKFLNPVAEGRLLALKRDLGRLGLWRLAWAVEKGLVLEDGSRDFFRWYQSEQVWPDCAALDAYFASPDYVDTVASVEAKATYSISQESLVRLGRG